MNRTYRLAAFVAAALCLAPADAQARLFGRLRGGRAPAGDCPGGNCSNPHAGGSLRIGPNESITGTIPAALRPDRVAAQPAPPAVVEFAPPPALPPGAVIVREATVPVAQETPAAATPPSAAARVAALKAELAAAEAQAAAAAPAKAAAPAIDPAEFRRTSKLVAALAEKAGIPIEEPQKTMAQIVASVGSVTLTYEHDGGEESATIDLSAHVRDQINGAKPPLPVTD